MQLTQNVIQRKCNYQPQYHCTMFTHTFETISVFTRSFCSKNSWVVSFNFLFSCRTSQTIVDKHRMQSMLSHYPRRTEVHIWDILHQSLLQNRRLFGPPKVPQKGLFRPYRDTCPSPRQAYESIASFSHPFCSASSSLVVLSLVSPSLLTFVPSELCGVLWLQLRSSFRLAQLCASPNHCNHWGNCCFLLQLLNRHRLWLRKNQHLRKCSLRAVPARGHGRGRAWAYFLT